MTELFLNKELSSLAKKKGFNEPCFGIRYDLGVVSPELAIMEPSSIEALIRVVGDSATKAPLYDQILNWFYKNHSIDIPVSVGITNKWSGYITINKGKVQGCPINCSHFNKKQQILDFLIEEAFKLIP